ETGVWSAPLHIKDIETPSEGEGVSLLDAATMSGFEEDQSRMTSVEPPAVFGGRTGAHTGSSRGQGSRIKSGAGFRRTWLARARRHDGQAPASVRHKIKIRHFGYACQDLVDAVRLRDANIVIKLRR